MSGAAPNQRAGSEITELLAAWRNGDREAGGVLAERIYPILKARARFRLAERGGSVSLRPTELVHEVYLKLLRTQQPDWENRAHFFGVAARLMRDILVDHVRSKVALKRGGGALRIAFEDANGVSAAPDGPDLLAIDEAVERLGRRDPLAAQLVELRFFGGLEIREAATVMGQSVSTLVRKWRYARAWLRRELAPL